MLQQGGPREGICLPDVKMLHISWTIYSILMKPIVFAYVFTDAHSKSTTKNKLQ